MRAVRAAVALASAFALALPGAALAEEPEEGKEVIALEAGRVAPFSGLLVPELRFIELLEAEVKVDSARAKAEAAIQYATEIERIYKDRLRESAAPQPWYKSPEYNLIIGFGLGLIVVSAAVYGGVQLASASR